MTEQIKNEKADFPDLELLATRLTELSNELATQGEWPQQQLRFCGEFGVFKWFIETEFGGSDWNDQEIVKGYIKLAGACLTTTFVITQRTGACKRLAASENKNLAQNLLPDLASGKTFATLGISHLTTSRRHLANPVLMASESPGGWLLNGNSPWVTGASHADYLVIGSEVEGGGQILLVVDTGLDGIEMGQPNQLVALSGSKTGAVYFDDVLIPHDCVLSGPTDDVLRNGRAKSTGGLQTSALAIGLASAALKFLQQEAFSKHRDDLITHVDSLRKQQQELIELILAMAGGESACTNEELRTRANSFALRATQSALIAAKGSGFVAGHPVGRWCQEALFFLVWSCPQVVRDASLCELVGIAD